MHKDVFTPENSAMLLIDHQIGTMAWTHSHDINLVKQNALKLARIAKAAYPDSFAWKKGHKYFDAASDKASPVWYMVDLAFVERFPEVVSLDTLKHTKGLEQMMVTRKGSRLSVQPVTREEYEIVVRLGRQR